MIWTNNLRFTYLLYLGTRMFPFCDSRTVSSEVASTKVPESLSPDRLSVTPERNHCQRVPRM